MAKHAPAGSLVIADSDFGSVHELGWLAENGFHGLLCCRKDRPASLLKNLLCVNLPDKQVATRFAKVEKNRLPFMATVSRSKKKMFCLLSTVSDSHTSEHTILDLESDETPENQSKLVKPVQPGQPQIRPIQTSWISLMKEIASYWVPFHHGKRCTGLNRCSVGLLRCVFR